MRLVLCYDTLDLLSVVVVSGISGLVAVFDNEISWKFVLLLCVLFLRLSSWWAILCLMHNVSKVDPLITSLILSSILSRVWCSSGYWMGIIYTHTLLLICADKDWRFTVTCTWRLWSLLYLLCWTGILDIWRHDVHDTLVLLDTIE